MREEGIRKARQTARALVRRFGIRAPEHVWIEALAKRLGITIVEGRLDGALAQLVRVGDLTQIIVSDRVTDRGALRFSIAHELGHYALEHPSRPPVELCNRARSKRSKSDERDHEAEANAFAGELLIPYELVHRWCEVSPVSLEVAWRIAREFDVSILTAAIRFAELASERCAAVFSAKREVLWFARSSTFTREIQRGQRIDPQSVAWDFFATGQIDDRAQPVPAHAWLETSSEADIVEHSIASRQHGTVLSLLWIPESSAAGLGMFA